MKKNKKILILGATINQLPFVLLAKKYSCFSISMDNVPTNIGHKYADQWANISTLDRDLVLKFAQREKISAIITCASDTALPTAAYVAEKMGLPSVSLRAVNTTVDKDNFHKFLVKHNFKVPKHYLFDSIDSAINKVAELSGQWIVKPSDSSGSKGVYFLDLDNQLLNLAEVLGHAMSFSRTNRLVLEEYIVGDHCSVDGFLNLGKIDKIIITNKLLTPLPYRTPLGHTVPSKLPVETQALIKATVMRILDLLGVFSSPFDFDMVVDRNGKISVLEMSLRIGGNGIPKLISFADGYDLYDSTLKYALGEVVSTTKTKSSGLTTGVFLIISKKSGFLNKIASRDEILKKYDGDIKELVYDVVAGDHVEKFISGNHRLGHFILQSESDEKLMSVASKLITDLAIRVSRIRND